MNTPERKPALALITGGAHRLGGAIARALAARYQALGLHYHTSEDEAHALAEELSAQGCQVTLLQADLRDPQQIADMFARLASSPLPLQVLVNSAGRMARGDLRTLSVDEWDEIMAINLRAPWLCAQQAAPLMAVSGGAIVNISDAGAGHTWTGYPAYILSKDALTSLTRLLARALAPAIRVNAIAPGLVLPSADLSPEQWQKLVQRVPLRRPATPEEIAAGVLFLVEHPYVTGQVLAIDGGYQLV